MVEFTASLQIWRGAEGSSHFALVPEEQAGELRAHAMANRRGFGSVKVEATIKDVTWRTSVFPQKTGGYFLPVKIEVCRRAEIAAGEDISVQLELL
jgi:hypothetical protein